MEGLDLVCSMCCGVFTDPIVTSCNHKFCKTCLHTSLHTQELEFNKMECSLCRHGLQDFMHQTWNINTKYSLMELYRMIDRSDISAGGLIDELIDSSERLISATCKRLNYKHHRGLIDDESRERQLGSLKSSTLTLKQQIGSWVANPERI